MSILEDNKLIAEFMGYSVWTTSAHSHNPEMESTSHIQIENREGERILYQPHKDWNQLMEVVEKIEKEATVTIEQDYCYIKLYNDLGIVEKEVWKKGNIKREAVYQAVLEYIKQQETSNGK